MLVITEHNIINVKEYDDASIKHHTGLLGNFLEAKGS